jgi:hypothetical protein
MGSIPIASTSFRQGFSWQANFFKGWIIKFSRSLIAEAKAARHSFSDGGR